VKNADGCGHAPLEEVFMYTVTLLPIIAIPGREEDEQLPDITDKHRIDPFDEILIVASYESYPLHDILIR